MPVYLEISFGNHSRNVAQAKESQNYFLRILTLRLTILTFSACLLAFLIKGLDCISQAFDSPYSIDLEGVVDLIKA